MKNEPMTKPTEVRPSCRPYWNSVAPSSLSEKGRSKTFQRPKEKNMNEPTMNSDRIIGVPRSAPRPERRLSTMTPTLASSSGVGMGYRPISEMHRAAQRNDAASMTKAHTSPTLPASSPAPAKPMAVDPKLAIDREGVGRRELLVAGDLGDEAVVGGVEELLDPGVDEEQERTGREGRSRRSR